MLTTILVITGPGPGGIQQIGRLDLPAVPLPGEHIDIDKRKYRALERSWRFNIPENIVEAAGVSVGLLVEQIAGPPHVITHSGGQAPN